MEVKFNNSLTVSQPKMGLLAIAIAENIINILPAIIKKLKNLVGKIKDFRNSFNQRDKLPQVPAIVSLLVR